MPGVVFHLDAKGGLGGVGKRQVYQRLDYTCRAWGADPVVAVDEHGDWGEFDRGPMTYARTLPDAMALAGDVEPVYIERDGVDELGEFDHPDAAVYVVGPDYGALDIPPGARSVHIDYPADIPLWSEVALGLVLYDRMVKCGNRSY